MPSTSHLQLGEIERVVCELAVERLGVDRDEVFPESRLIEDLNCDSLDLTELFMALEGKFDLTLQDDRPDSVYKSVFTRQPFRISDLAELVYLQQGTGQPERNWRGKISKSAPCTTAVPFTQLNGRWRRPANDRNGLFDAASKQNQVETFRRRSDGMRCILLPAAEVEIGCPDANAQPDESPIHRVQLDAFLIDAEPVSTTAYCRFLNSIGDKTPEVLAEWFVLDPDDKRREHQLVRQVDLEWEAIAGTEQWPIMLVSWYGANAYSLWANGRDWKQYRDEQVGESASFLPSEAQWEYAARGARYQAFPWGDELPTSDLMRFGQHHESAACQLDSLPLANVNATLGMSPFGLHHMAGNVWQWCRDWYDGMFYHDPAASEANPVNRKPTQIRSERGGSWVGPAEICRSSYRRGRNPLARGRCLGFRCVSLARDLQ